MLWIILLIVLVAGGVGGVVNSLLTDNGFLRPKTEKVGETTSMNEPSYIFADTG